MIRACRWWLPKLRGCHSSLQKNHSAEAFPHTLNPEDATDLLFFSPARFPLSKISKGPLLSYPLTFYTHTPLSIWASWVPSPSAPKFPSSAWEPHPSLLLLDLQGQLTPFSFFSLLHHQESIWIRGGLQGTQTKAQNGPTTLPKTDLELMGLSHVGFGSRNY